MKSTTTVSFLIFACLFATSNVSLAQIHTSTNNKKGDWSQASTWTKSHAYLKDVPGNDSGATINIYGVVTSYTNLTLGNNVTINLYDTLIVEGDFKINGGAKFTIHGTGVLIVKGDYIASNNSTTTNYGTAVVTGKIHAFGSGKVYNQGTFYAFETSTNDGGIITGIYGKEQALFDNNTPLYNLTMYGSSILPVELLYFTGKIEPTAMDLKWATSSESNFDFFSIERSTDLITWSSLGTVPGAGNSTSVQVYSFQDRSPVSGKSYYRLKATDFDGSIEYHDVISVNFPPSISASLFPNPSNGRSLFIVAGFEPGAVSVVNLSGKEIHRSILTAGKNEIIFAQTLERGFYLVTVKQGSAEQKLKLQVN